MTLRFIRRKVAQPLFMIPMCALILYFTVDVKAHATNAVGNYSGEELFKGVFFAEGRVAAAIPELQGLNVRDYVSDAAKLNTVLNTQNQIFNAMRSTDYFSTLQAAIGSHNQLQIQRALNTGATLVKAKTSELGFGISAEQEQAILKSIKSEDYSRASLADIKAAVRTQVEVMDGTELGIYACIAILLVLVLLLLVAFVLVIPLVADTNNDSLYQESLVNSLSKL